MKLSNFKIGYRLGLGFGLLILVFAVSSIFAISETKSMTELNEKLYTHPFAVSNALKDIRADIIAMHRGMKDVALARGPEEIGEAEKIVASFEKDALENFDLVLDRYLGEKTEIKFLKRTFIAWRPIRNEVIELMKKGKSRDAVIITKGKGARHVSELNEKINDLVRFAMAKSLEFHTMTHRKESQTVRLEMVLFGLSIVLASIVSFLLTRSIISPLKNVLGMAESIQKGELSHRLNTGRGDEIGQLADALNVMADSLEKNRSDLEKARNGMAVRVNERTAELLEANEKLNQVQASLYRQGKLASIGQLAAGVAHEINNPLGFVSSNFTTLEKYFKSIGNYLQLVEDSVLGVPEGPERATHETIEKMKEHKEKMRVDFILDDAPDIFSESHEGFDRIKNIVENLRSFSRVDYEHKIEKYDINQAVENTLAVAGNELKYAADVETEFSNVSLIECRGDEINQVLLNIIVNAAQAIKSQNREEMGKMKIKTYQEEKHVYCEISDDGPGIPGEVIDKIFDPFFTTKEVGKGTGLGLNICHDIVINKHGGDLTVKSEVGKGSTFSIKLPTGSTFKARESKE